MSHPGRKPPAARRQVLLVYDEPTAEADGVRGRVVLLLTDGSSSYKILTAAIPAAR